MRNYICSFLWLVPFIAFFSGYQTIKLFSPKKVIQIPNLIGQHINNAINILSSSQLNVRILAQKEDPDLPDGMIIDQTPVAGQSVKSNQSVFLVITCKPAKSRAISLYNLDLSQALSKCKEKFLHCKWYYMPSYSPVNTCIAQSSQPGQEIKHNTISIYISSGITSIRIFPNLKDQRLSDVCKFLEKYNLEFQAFSPNKEIIKDNYDNYIILDQRPMAGTLVDIKKSFKIQLTVSKI